MRVLHLDVPRGLSFTLREWSWGCASALADADGKGWRQVDLNFDFWPWILDDGRTNLFARIVDAHLMPGSARDAVRGCEAAAARAGERLGCRLDLRGPSFPPDVAASPMALVELARSMRTFDPYFLHIAAKYMLLSGYSVISLGVDSEDALVFAGLLAAFVRRHDPDMRIVLSRHQYENYSLVHRVPELAELLGLFDAIVHYEEQLADALSSLLVYWKTGDRSQLVNVLVQTDTGPLFVPTRPSGSAQSGALAFDPQYIRDTGVPPDRLLYFAPVIRNACYYGRCTFCVQNERYLIPQAFKYERELDRSMEAISRLTDVGVRAFTFSDQALHPRAVAALSKRLCESDLRIQWCGRMLADPVAIDDTLLATMRAAGCREILFGLESVRRETLRAMDKDVCGEREAVSELVDRAARNGIDVVLSMMFGFPTETDEQFESTTLPFIQRMRERANVTSILNRFALFRDTPMEREPARFGIRELHEVSGPLAITRSFSDVHGRSTTEPHPRERHYRTEVPADYIDYSSIGLVHRWRTGQRVGEAPVAVERDVLVIGASSYVGQNLLPSLDARRLLLSGRGPRSDTAAAIDAPWFRADLTAPSPALEGLSPREVYIVARPRGGIEQQAPFAAQLKILLHRWAHERLERVVFLSTQLVYPTPADATPVPSTTPLAPVAPYEYFKAELESFLQHLTTSRPLAVDVFRLPLVFGGTITDEQRASQLIYVWCDQLANGARWRFESDRDRAFGNSWVWMPDLVSALTTRGRLRFAIRQPVSGHFTYAGLQDVFGPAATEAPRALRLVRSQFFLADEEGLPSRDLLRLTGALPKAEPLAPQVHARD
jgi:hypothetical protein